MKVVEKSVILETSSRDNEFSFGSSDMAIAMDLLNEFRRFCNRPELQNIDLDDLTVINFWLDLTVEGNK